MNAIHKCVARIREGSVRALFAVVVGFAADALAEAPQDDSSAPNEESTIPVEPIPDDSDSIPPSGDKPTVLDTIEVTGSHIRRTDYETAAPVLVITRADIERSGFTNVGEFLQEIPTAGSAQNRMFNNGGNGQTEIDLRNLGSKRVLVLVNGHRWIGGTDVLNTSAINLNTIPFSLVDRIEILKDGASAIYGSDAIVGVVNIITRTDYIGDELRMFASGFIEGDSALQQSYQLSFGNVAGKTSLFLNLGYVQQSALMAGERDMTAVPVVGTGLTRGSPTTPRGRAIFVPTTENGEILGEVLCPTAVGIAWAGGQVDEGAGNMTFPFPNGVQLCDMTLVPGQTITGDSSETTATVASRYEPFNFESLDPSVNDLYNYGPLNFLLTPFEQQSVFAQVRHPLVDDLNLNIQILYLTTLTERQLAETVLLFGSIIPTPTFYSVYVDATQVFNPFGQDIGRYQGQGTSGDIGFGSGLGLIQRRMVEAGPRFLSRELQTLVARSALDGSFDLLNRAFTWNLGLQQARSDLHRFIRGDFDMERVKRSLGPASDCGSNTACVPLNIFGSAGSITQDMLDYLTFSATSSARAEITDTYLNFTTEIAELGRLLPGPVGIAFGMESREESFADHPDSYAQAGISSISIGRVFPTEGRLSVKEAYLELAVPLLRDRIFANDLDLTLAGRYVSYTGYTAKASGKAGLRWKPYDDLLLRTTVSDAYRAPGITERDLGGNESFVYVTDPCIGDSASGQREEGTVEDQNCDSEQVPDPVLDFVGAATPVTQVGNDALRPETARTYTAGVVWSPGFIPDFNIYVDWYLVDLQDFIDYLNADYVLQSCYQRDPASPRPQTCDFVERDPTTGVIQSVFAATYNFAAVQTSGVELLFDYALPIAAVLPRTTGLGTLRLQFDSNYLSYYDRSLANADGGATLSRYAGQMLQDQPFPRFKFRTSLIWSVGQWVTSWTTRYIHHVQETCNDTGFKTNFATDSPATLRNLGVCSDPDPDLSDGLDNSTNRISSSWVHDAYIGYDVPSWDMKFAVGALNVTNQNPPVSYSAFANSFSATAYRAPGIQPFLSVTKQF